MPFRCKSCETIVSDIDEHICEKTDNPTFDKLAIIHLASKNGIGRIMGSQVVTTVGENETKTENVVVRLHCLTTAESPPFTGEAFATTCPKCLKSIT